MALQRIPQTQDQQPGREEDMIPEPKFVPDNYQGSRKLQDKVAIITGGDSGIGRAISVLFAKEGANVVISYLEENEDADKTRALVEAEGGKCVLIRGDISQESVCRSMVKQTVSEFGQLDVLVNNAAEQHPQQTITDISAQQLLRTFETNIFSFFYLTQQALPHLKKGASIINTSSVTAYRGSAHLLDYSATKGAIVGFTRSLSANLAGQGIRVNAVAPGPIWTPLIPSTFPAMKVATFGSDVPLGRAGQPAEVAPAYVYLASDDSSYMTGQVLHVNGGEIVNG